MRKMNVRSVVELGRMADSSTFYQTRRKRQLRAVEFAGGVSPRAGCSPLNAPIKLPAQSHRHGGAAYEGIDFAIQRMPPLMNLEAEASGPCTCFCGRY